MKNFNSFIARLGRRFAGIPFYIGHPDVPGYENIFPDRKAYGWIMELEARDDGLYGRPKWSKAGHGLIENGHYKFLSPYWEAANVGHKDGKPVLRPTVLISVGLTNQPNIPVLPLANDTDHNSTMLLGTSLPITSDIEPETTSRAENSELQTLSAEPPQASPSFPSRPSVQYPESPIPNSPSSSLNGESKIGNCEFTARLSALETANQKLEIRNQKFFATLSQLETRNAKLETAVSDLSNRLENSVSQLKIINEKSEIRADELSQEFQIQDSKSQIERLDELETRNKELETALELINSRMCNSLLNHAISDTRILPAERDYWLHQLESNFEAASTALANAESKLNRQSRTENLPLINTPTPVGKTRTDQILALVNERMCATGQPFHQSWIETKKHHPNLFL